MCFRLLGIMASSLLCIASLSVHAQSSSSGTLDLNSLTVTPQSGTIDWNNAGWSLGSITSVANSDGGSDQESSFDNPTATSTATTAYATGTSTATAPGLDVSGLSGNASGSISIPGGINEAAIVSGGFGNFASFETQFTNSMDTSVTISAMLTAAQTMMTDAGGQVLNNELIFDLNVDGNNVLFYDNPLVLGSSASSESGPSPIPLSDVINLSAGEHDVFVFVDSEQQVLETSAVPEPGTMLTGILLLLPFGSRALRGLRKLDESGALEGGQG